MIVQERYREVDWEQYFQSISDVCPWSLEAYQNDLIKFARYSDTKVFYHDETWHTRKHMAVIYYDVSSDLTLQVNVENVRDELYFPHSHSSHQASVGEPQNARLSLRYTF